MNLRFGVTNYSRDLASGVIISHILHHFNQKVDLKLIDEGLNLESKFNNWI